jgi:hypothetical protein
VDRVDKAMEPILKKLQKLRAERDALEVPDDPHAALRAMVRRAFPNLTLMPARSYGDRSPERFLWDGPRPHAR